MKLQIYQIAEKIVLNSYIFFSQSKKVSCFPRYKLSICFCSENLVHGKFSRHNLLFTATNNIKLKFFMDLKTLILNNLSEIPMILALYSTQKKHISNLVPCKLCLSTDTHPQCNIDIINVLDRTQNVNV